ncbi:MAG: hypothetical protein IJL66_03585 [Lachnospiraceae bacterium]|nr:hypothetical protein [Lachnospiraceae bacterium]
MIEKEDLRQAMQPLRASEVPQMRDLERRIEMKRRNLRSKIVLALAVFVGTVMLTNAVAYAATGETWIGRIYSLHFAAGNGAADVEVSRDGDSSGITVTAGDGTGYSVYEDEKTFFVFGNIKKDVSAEVADGGYYLYEYTDGKGVLHRIFVGEGQWAEGTDGAEYLSGWMEQFYLPDGHKASMTGAFSENDVHPAWLRKAETDYPLYYTGE